MTMFDFGNGSNLPHPGNDIVLVTTKGITYRVDAEFEFDTRFMSQNACCPSCGEQNQSQGQNDLALKMYLSGINEIYQDETMEEVKTNSQAYNQVMSLLTEYLDNAECSACGYLAPKAFFDIC